MALSRVRIANVRCLRDVELELDPKRSFIFGPNGAGKTSLLEALFLLGRGRSFRTRQLRRLVRHGDHELAVYGEVTSEGRQHRLGVAVREGRLEKKINGQEASGMAALAEALPVYAIHPGIHALVEGGPSERRRFLDWGVFHVEQGYLEAWKRYRRVLSQRNAALKTRLGSGELRAWDAALVESGIAVDLSRKAYVARLATSVEQLSRQLLQQAMQLEYRSGWRAERSFADALAEGEAGDRTSGTTEAGPHRAELVLKLEGRRLQDEASRGQQKLAAAALVLGQVALDPSAAVLLIDDPGAELDAAALERLTAVLDGLGAQLVVTGLSPPPRTAGYPVFHVERGDVQAL